MEPQSERELRQLFDAMASSLGFRVLKSQERFPDYPVVLDLRWGHLVSIEAELRGCNFGKHGHPPTCDYIVCWDASEELIEGIPVIQLKRLIAQPREYTAIRLDKLIQGRNRWLAQRVEVPLPDALEEALDELREYSSAQHYWQLAEKAAAITDRFGRYGTYKAMAEVTGYTTRRLATFVRAAKTFEPRLRFPGVSFTLYEVAMSSDKPIVWLHFSLGEGLIATELARVIDREERGII